MIRISRSLKNPFFLVNGSYSYYYFYKAMPIIIVIVIVIITGVIYYCHVHDEL